jgi:hypothetical protein
VSDNNTVTVTLTKSNNNKRAKDIMAEAGLGVTCGISILNQNALIEKNPKGHKVGAKGNNNTAGKQQIISC